MKMNWNPSGVFAICFGVSFALVSPPRMAGAEQSQSTSQVTIPSRPEQLVFPPLAYEPPSPESYRMVLKSGPVAYVVPDRELPLVNIVVMVKTGHYLSPPGKEGLPGMTAHLLARGGAGSKSAQELDERLAFLAARLESGADDTQSTVSLNLLSKDLDEGLALLREVLTVPRFEEDRLELSRQQQLQAMQQRNDESEEIEDRESDRLAYGEAFWKNQLATEASVKSITRADLVAFHRAWFHPSNFVVAASGDFERDALARKLENLFEKWPFEGTKPPVVPTNTVFAAPGAYVVNKEVNQGRVSIYLPGVMREDADYFGVLVMNRILGGGGFTSRITARVRSDEGLAYSAYSSFQGGVYYPVPFVASFQSKSRTVAYATSIVVDEMQKIAAAPVTEEELNTAKRSYIDTLPRNFATKTQIATAFATDEFTGRFARDPHFWKNFRQRIEASTIADVQKVAKRFMDLSKLVILVVGDKKEIALGNADHPVTLESLAGGHLTELPLRDPLTLKPIK